MISTLVAQNPYSTYLPTCKKVSFKTSLSVFTVRLSVTLLKLSQYIYTHTKKNVGNICNIDGHIVLEFFKLKNKLIIGPQGYPSSI